MTIRFGMLNEMKRYSRSPSKSLSPRRVMKVLQFVRAAGGDCAAHGKRREDDRSRSRNMRSQIHAHCRRLQCRLMRRMSRRFGRAAVYRTNSA